jgi:hypothetical protein
MTPIGIGGQRGRLIVADGGSRQAMVTAPLPHEQRNSQGPRLQLARPEVLGIEAARPRGHGYPVATICVLIGFALMLAGSGGHGLAQAPAIDVAYVEAVAGRATASSQGTSAELDILDPLNDGTRLDLQKNAVLRLCHYRTHHLLILKGPLRASVSAAGVIAENGTAIAGSGETCATPVISTFQGGLALRGLAPATPVALQPRIRIINRGTRSIKKLALRDIGLQSEIATFSHSMAQPQLTNGETYLLVVDFADGTQWTAMFRASATTETNAVIVVVR